MTISFVKYEVLFGLLERFHSTDHQNALTLPTDQRTT